MGFRTLGFWTPRPPAIRTTGLLTFALAGLSPAEHTSLYRSQLPDGQIPESGLKPWHVIRGPSRGLGRFKRWFVYTPATPGLLTVSPP
jgi:hypothetical protein